MIVSIWLQYRSLRYSIQFLTELCAGARACILLKPLAHCVGGQCCCLLIASNTAGTTIEPAGRADYGRGGRAARCAGGRMQVQRPNWSMYLMFTVAANKTSVAPPPGVTALCVWITCLHRCASPLAMDLRSGWKFVAAAAVIISARFCNVNPFLDWTGRSSWRGYPLDMVVNQMSELYARGACRFYFVDDIFFGPGRQGQTRVLRVCCPAARDRTGGRMADILPHRQRRCDAIQETVQQWLIHRQCRDRVCFTGTAGQAL